jgi:hypothetical protein
MAIKAPHVAIRDQRMETNQHVPDKLGKKKRKKAPYKGQPMKEPRSSEQLTGCQESQEKTTM